MCRWDRVDSSCFEAVVALVCTQIQLLHRPDVRCYAFAKIRTTGNLVQVKSLSCRVEGIVEWVINTVGEESKHLGAVSVK